MSIAEDLDKKIKQINRNKKRSGALRVLVSGTDYRNS
jgi:hypothetical protein